MNDDLDTPGALAVLWDMTKDDTLSPEDIAAGIRDADRILGIGLSQPSVLKQLIKNEVAIAELPGDIALLVEKREEARSDKDWKRSDELRSELNARGYLIEDKASGPTITLK
jgi:cysteinyl-tRNA synthetase